MSTKNKTTRIDEILKKNFSMTAPSPEMVQLAQDIISAQERAYWKRVHNPKERPQEAMIIYDMEIIREVIRKRGDIYLNRFEDGGKYIIDGFNKRAIGILAQYFLRYPEFNSLGKGYSLKKGIYIRSATKGTGKTLLMKLFAHSALWEDNIRFYSYPLHRVIACRKVVSQYRKDGEKIYDHYCEPITGNAAMSTWCFDELGREDQAANSFGNRTNVMEKIMADRYDLFIDQGIKTHLTSNIVNGNDIERLYGDYLRSRFREMFNVIDLDGEDRRA